MNIRDYISSGIVEAFVLGLASEEEVSEVVRLRKLYPQLDEAIISFEISLEQTHLQQAVAPPPALKARLSEALEDSFAEPQIAVKPLLPEAETPKIISVARPAWFNYAAAAVIILLISNAFFTLGLYRNYQSLKQDYASLQQENSKEKLRFNSLYADVFRMQDSKMQVVKMKGVPGKDENLATIFWDAETKDVYLFKNKLPQAATGKQFQLWAIVDGKPVDAGVIAADCEGLCKLKKIDRAQAFAITLEKEGGSPVPTLAEMYVMGGI